MKRSLLLVFCCCLAGPTSAQVTITYFPFKSILGVSTSTENKVWGGVNLETNTFLSNSNIELQGCFTVKKTPWVNYYLGLGINVTPFAALHQLFPVNGYTLTFGTRIKPFSAVPGGQVVFEVAPYSNPYFDGGYIRTLLGIAYNFQRHPQKEQRR